MKKKRHIAACVAMSVAIAASIPLGINRSLARVREDAAGQYYYDDVGFCLYEGIENRQEAANSLITVAERYVEQEPTLKPLIEELAYRVQASYNAYDDDDSFTKTVRANQALDAPAQELSQALQGITLSEKDQKYPAQLIDQMKSEQDKLARSSYNDAARAFNAKLEKMRPMALLHPMSTFDKVDTTEQAVPADTSIPSPPAMRESPDAPDLDEIVERAQEFADDTANGATDFADDVADWAEGLGEEISGRVTDAFGG